MYRFRDAAAARPMSEASVRQFEALEADFWVPYPRQILAMIAERLGEDATARVVREQMLAVLLRGGDHRNTIETLTALGWLQIRAGELAGALRRFTHAIRIHQQTDGGTADGPMEGIAAVAALGGQPEQAVRLWEAVSALRRQRRMAPHAFARDADAARAAARAVLGEAAADAGFQAGALLSEEQAMAEALTVAANMADA